jgi:uncharacterized Tic20 family protein
MEELKQEETISKHLAVIEVYSRLRLYRVSHIISIVGFFVILITYILNKWLGMITTLAFTLVIAYFLIMIVNEMKRFEGEYKLK